MRACEGAGSGLDSCVKPIDDLTRGDDADALVAAHAQQMPIPRDDDLSAAGHGCGDDVIDIAAVSGSGL